MLRRVLTFAVAFLILSVAFSLGTPPRAVAPPAVAAQAQPNHFTEVAATILLPHLALAQAVAQLDTTRPRGSGTASLQPAPLSSANADSTATVNENKTNHFNWLWIVVAIVVLAGLALFFLSRRPKRTTMTSSSAYREPQ